MQAKAHPSAGQEQLGTSGATIGRCRVSSAEGVNSTSSEGGPGL